MPRTRAAKRWQIVAGAPHAADLRVQRLAADLGCHPVAAQILIARGFETPGAARSFLSPSLAGLHDPLRLRDMDLAVGRLKRAIDRHETIEIHGDYDVDGTISTVVLRTAIRMAGGDAGFFIPHRIRDGYGIRDAAVEAAANRGTKLIISVDTGIRAAAAVERANRFGIDVIVTDHHLPDATLPPALAVVNPNRPDCDYPEKNLCGAGVAFKLAHGLLQTLGLESGKRDRILSSFLKLVAIATVADVVPLTGENRTIVAHGIRGLSEIRNPGLRALLECAGVQRGQAPTVHQIGFRIAPRLNAAGRMASAEEVMQLFGAEDDAAARELAERLSRLNADRQDEEARIVEEILRDCENRLPAQIPAALVFAGESWHRGVLGIVASRVAEKFCRPTFVLGIQNGEAVGSGRSIPAFHLLHSLEAMKHLFVKFGGHKQAAGVTIETQRVDEFRSAFETFAASALTQEDFVPIQKIDAEVSLSHLNDALWRSLERLQPFGMGNPCPVLMARGITVVSEPQLVKERHLRFSALQDGRMIQFRAFEFAERRSEVVKGATLDVAFQLAVDEYQGGWSAHVCDLRPATAQGS